MASQEKRIGIFVIAYNAVNKLDWTLDRQYHRTYGTKSREVFLFDDCSTDNTFYAAMATKHSKASREAHRSPAISQNLRYGGNQKAGYQYAIARVLDM